MVSTVWSASVYGVESRLVRVEADVGEGLPSFSMVGDLSAQVKEAQERVRSALRNSGRALKPQRITVSLSPADMRKYGSGFDLAIAVAVAAGNGEIPRERLEKTLIVGELSLGGEVRAVTGILPIVADALAYGCTACVIPAANVPETACVQGIAVIGVEKLDEAIAYLQGKEEPKRRAYAAQQGKSTAAEVDFSEIRGQELVRRAAEVAVAGGHNLLMVGPPGAGKSMIAKRIPTILPPLTEEEQMEVRRIYSAAGVQNPEEFLLYNRPFRAPHHTVTARALAGGGLQPRPGELSLAHRGVLFLDELPEFSREALEVLRQPLEEGRIAVSRAGGNYSFPADVMLVAAMNPCPCGHFPDMQRCSCTYPAVKRYLGRISGPLLERMDITAEASPIGYESLKSRQSAESSAAVRERVLRARRIQEERYAAEGFSCNARLSSEAAERYCVLGETENGILRQAFEKLGLSVRTYYRVLRVARTIADLAGRAQICADDLQEALCYRSVHRKYWTGR